MMMIMMITIQAYEYKNSTLMKCKASRKSRERAFDRNIFYD
jgi:hypothetical protein